MSNSADNSPMNPTLDEDSDVIELTNEVADPNQEEDLAFAIPAFRVPTGQLPAAPKPSEEPEDSDEDPFDREELVRTVRMEAVDRSQIDLLDALRKFSIDSYLEDQHLAPDVLVAPPRVLTKKWQDGPAPTSTRTSANESTERGDVSTVRVATVTDEDIAKAQAESQEVIEVEAPVSEPGMPGAPFEADEIQDAIELDSEVLEDATPLPKPPPKPEAPVERPRHNTKPIPQAPQAAAKPAASPAPAPKADDDDIGGIVQELLEEKKPKRVSAAEQKRANWFVDVFSDEYMRTLPKDLPKQTEKEVEFILDSLGLKKGARIFDLACGFGRHSLELARRGYEVAGLDLSMAMLQRALNDAQKRSLSIKFIHGDMRDLNFNEIFDGCFLWQTSFGYFDDKTNFRVLQGVHRALKSGGRFLMDVVNRDYVVAEMPSRTWWEGVECVFLEEVEFDYMTSIMHTKRSFIYEDGSPPQEFNSYIRLYGLHELNQILQIAGFDVVEVSGEVFHRGNYLGPSSSHTLVLAEKR